jgi:putative transposase
MPRAAGLSGDDGANFLVKRAHYASRHLSPVTIAEITDLEYPFHDRTITVTTCGRICLGRRKINLSIMFAGQNVGVKEVSDKIWLVSFMKYDLGFFDQEVGRVTSVENPFDAKVLPMSPV